MSTLTKSRRMPAKYRVRAGGITEIVYSATPEVIVVLPGTRWLEQRREREARLAAEAAERVTPITSHPARAKSRAARTPTKPHPRMRAFLMGLSALASEYPRQADS